MDCWAHQLLRGPVGVVVLHICVMGKDTEGAIIDESRHIASVSQTGMKVAPNLPAGTERWCSMQTTATNATIGGQGGWESNPRSRHAFGTTRADAACALRLAAAPMARSSGDRRSRSRRIKVELGASRSLDARPVLVVRAAPPILASASKRTITAARR